MSVNPSVSIRSITPDLAAEWLKKNHKKNRKRRMSKVKEYAEAMMKGKWFLAVQVIAFDSNGVLINGQHTLDAVILSGKTIKCIVLMNCSTEAILVLDGGLKRSSDDRFGMAGRNYPSGCGQTIRRLIAGVKQGSNAITEFVIDDYMKKYNSEVTLIHNLTQTKKYFTASLRAALVRALIAKTPKNKIERFVEVLDTGLMETGENAAILLRNRILDKKNITDSKKSRMNMYSLCEMAISEFSKGSQTKLLRPTKQELFPLKDIDDA
jgi:hypothetical protein